LLVTVDREKVKALGLQVSDITSTLQVFMGSVYVNDFDLGSRAYRVYVQADQPFRATPDDLGASTCGPGGRMIRLEDVVHVSQTTSPQIISHYNLFRSAEITGSAAPGFSSGEAIRLMDELAARTLPAGMGYEWSGLSREEIKAGGQAVLIFGLGLLLVYLTLAAQYESLSLPFIVMLSVPLAVLGALGAQSLRGFIQRRLLPDRAADADRPRGQERDPGRRVRRAAARQGARRGRGGHRGGTHPPAADPDDVARVHPRRDAARLRVGRRQGRASLGGTTVAGGMFVSTFLNLAVIPVLYVVVTLVTERLWGRSTAGRR
jgi:hydrophobic/amphiphilic exporter-1 (mainly G- bacteria), HAE1 family